MIKLNCNFSVRILRLFLRFLLVKRFKKKKKTICSSWLSAIRIFYCKQMTSKYSISSSTLSWPKQPIWMEWNLPLRSAKSWGFLKTEILLPYTFGDECLASVMGARWSWRLHDTDHYLLIPRINNVVPKSYPQILYTRKLCRFHKPYIYTRTSRENTQTSNWINSTHAS